mmetsp:Transcript_4996/g.11879  ORF Transcript_4996/g.11879 Transcript_4996/m.11879 type:complete len:949 (-) Transcript_4996:1792-4638(-)|eukprot:CAMPEP_0113610756 /NCGR_PEP_ID=MMETSP0017_2-20120614/5195_1 /TAXON_ID=2856 /ORGANISM="Cylindrotheca closterium" /LENGTH=948 /DNA_ID=CAMNT_0000519663 /DNA_START=295 /DNA_END=3141 /DNA_ORIENTATION=+ /assembly_acc=CAM_ASM_000147
MILKRTDESTADASEEEEESVASSIHRDAETEVHNTDTDTDNNDDDDDDDSDSEDFEEDLNANDEVLVSQDYNDYNNGNKIHVDARDQESSMEESLEKDHMDSQEGIPVSQDEANLDQEPNTAPSDSNEESIKNGTSNDDSNGQQAHDESSNGSDGETSESDEELSSGPLEEAKLATQQLLSQKLKERQQIRNSASASASKDPSTKRFRNIDLFSLKKRHSKSDLLDGEEEEEERDLEGSDAGSDGEGQNENIDVSSATTGDDSEKSDSKDMSSATGSAETESPTEPSVADTAEDEDTHSEQEETRNPSEAQPVQQTETTDATVGNDETDEAQAHTQTQVLPAPDQSSSADNSVQKGAESQSPSPSPSLSPTNEEPEKQTGDNDEHGENDDASDSASPEKVKVESPASNERGSKDEKHEKDGDAAKQDDKSKSKKPKDSSKKTKSKKKEKRKDKKSKSRKSTSKKTKPKRKSYGSVGSQRLQGKRPSVPLDTLDEQNEHFAPPYTSQDPRQSETSLSLLLNSIEQTHLGSRSNQTVGEYSAGSFISDTGWSDGTSSSYDTDEDDNSLSSSGSLKAEHDDGAEHENEDTVKQNLDRTLEQQDVEVPSAPAKDHSSPKLATAQIVKRLFAKKKYDSLEGDAPIEVQKSPSTREGTTHRKSTSLSIVANLFRRRKQKLDVPEAPEDDTELEENTGDAKEKGTHDTLGVKDVERQNSPKADAKINDGENTEGDAAAGAVTSAEMEADSSLKEETTGNQEDGKADGPEEVTLNEGNAEQMSAESNAAATATPVLRDDGNIEEKPENDEHPNVQRVEENNGIESVKEKEKHKTHPKKKDGHSKKKKDKGVSGNRARSDSVADGSGGKVSKKKEKEGGSKRLSKSVTGTKKKRKPTDSNKEKDSPGQEAKVLAKKKTKKPVQNRATSESSGVAQEENGEEEKVSKAKVKRKTGIV